jgi:hypothetical protein
MKYDIYLKQEGNDVCIMVGTDTGDHYLGSIGPDGLTLYKYCDAALKEKGVAVDPDTGCIKVNQL